MDFHGIRALITGGSSGIGLALSQQLAAEGANVLILARDRDRLTQAAESIRASRASANQTVETLSADVADLEWVQEALAPLTTPDRLPDLLINSAGAAHPGYAEELGLDIFHWMADVNYYGTVHVTQTLLRPMVQRGSGKIVNIASVAGFLAVYGYTAYGASKFAVRGYSDALRAEMKPKGIDVSIVYPPDTQTPQLEYENQFKPAETKALAGNVDAMSPEEVAAAILKGVQRKRYAIIPGMEGKLLYWLSGALGTSLYPLMDWMVSRAQAQAAKPTKNMDTARDEGKSHGSV
jgi:3-dehydrosphinganine reductase